MIPIRDHNPTHRRAIVVPVLIAINVVVFLFVQPTLTQGASDRRQVEQLAFFVCKAAIPYEVTHGETLGDAVGQARDPGGFGPFQARRCPEKRVWVSILVSMFLHGGWLHIAGNMLFLWVFGNNVEDRLGRARFVLFYLLSGLAATYAQSYVSPDSVVPMVGASGAIAGVLGAYLLMFPRARVTSLVIFYFVTTVELPAIVVLGVWFVLQLFSGVGSVTGQAGGVAYFAHVGGFVAGMLLLLVFRPRRQPERAAREPW